MLQGHSGERSSEGIGEGTGLRGHGMQRLARQQVGMGHGGGALKTVWISLLWGALMGSVCNMPAKAGWDAGADETAGWDGPWRGGSEDCVDQPDAGYPDGVDGDFVPERSQWHPERIAGECACYRKYF